MASEPSAAVDCAHPVGEWENEFGSVLEIQAVDSSTGSLTGRYMLAAAPGQWFPAHGWVNSGTGSKHTVPKVISFAVHPHRTGLPLAAILHTETGHESPSSFP